MACYSSCQYIQCGISFYPSNTIKFCCFSMKNDVDICTIDENTDLDEIVDNIDKKRAKVIKLQKQGIIFDSCKNCSCLKKGEWAEPKDILSITFNHYMKCNLKCEHCSYVDIRDEVKDTDDELIFSIVRKLYERNLISEKTVFDIGGGEPSLSKGIDKILEYAMSKGIVSHVNSNIAKYNELYVKGALEDKIKLTLTPDAGSREVYKKIKGADYFEIMKRNLQQYMQQASDKIEVKFIIENDNVDDIENMIKLCTDTGVKNVVLSFDLNIKEGYSNYRPYIRQFKNLCDENGLNFTTRLMPQELLLELEILKYEKALAQIKNDP